MEEPPPKRQKVPDSTVNLEDMTILYDQILQDSNFFKLQLEQLLLETSIKEKHYSLLNKWLLEFTSLVKNLPVSKPFQLKHKNWISENNLVLPFKLYEDLPEMPGGTFTFMPPEKVNFVGSVPLKIATNQQTTADVMLTLPKAFMEHQDMTNGRWLVRRVLYLTWLGKLLTEPNDLVSSVHWSYHCNCSLRPILQITPSGRLGAKWKINLFPIPFENYFKLTKVSPDRPNLNPSWFFKKEDDKGEKGPPTPFHNWACGIDLVMAEHHRYIKEHLKNENVIQGMKLLKIWMNQRGLNQGEGSLSNHMLTLYVMHLLRIRKVTPQMSTYQIFRSVLLAISTEKWFEAGPSLAPKKEATLTPTLEDFHNYFPVVFIDPTGFLNIASCTSTQATLEAQHEAKKTLDVLESSASSSDTFDALFIRRVEFHLNFDQLIHIKLNKNNIIHTLENEKNPEETILDRLGDVRESAWRAICSTLAEAYGDRIGLLGVLRRPALSWPLGDPPPILDSSLTIGLLLEPINAFRLLTKGPSAESPESKDFREFWGDICSLRRFQDTSFHEAVLWGDAGDPIGDRRLIPGKIARHVLKLHHSLKEEKVLYVADQFEKTLRMDHYQMDAKYGTGEEANTAAILAYDSLSKKLRSLDLPLKVSSIHSSSCLIKHCYVFPPLAKSAAIPIRKASSKKLLHTLLPPKENNAPHYRYAMKVLIFFELSGKWPDDLTAIQAIKVEFLSKIASLFRSDGITCIVFPHYLQIIWEGYIFRIEVCYRREIYLRQIKARDSPEEDLKSEESSWALEKRIEVLPKMATHLNSLQSDFPSYGGSVRLILRWVSSQMLLPHVPHIVVELFVAYLFLNPAPYSPPCTPHVALLRFLQMVSTTSFKRVPFLVNLGALFTVEDEARLIEKFAKDRDEFPALFMCTPTELKTGGGVGNPESDGSGNQDILARLPHSFEWTERNVTPPILARLKLLAAAALDHYFENIFQPLFDPLVLFRPPLNDYDVEIHLISSVLSRRAEAIEWEKFVTINSYSHTSGERMPTVMFDPVECYLKELVAAYDSHALFFHDEHGGQVIGVVWKPETHQPQNVKLSNVCAHKFIDEENTKQIANIEAIIEDFKILGEGLIEEVRIKAR